MKYDELYDWTNTRCYADSNMHTNISFPSRAVCNSLAILLYNKYGIIQASAKYLQTVDHRYIIEIYDFVEKLKIDYLWR